LISIWSLHLIFITFSPYLENALFVLIFCPDSHFGPYILFLPHLVPILKNVIYLSHFRQCPNNKILGGRQNY